MPSAVEPELLERLLARHGAALELFAAQWVDNPEDCVQEAFVALARQEKVPDDAVAWLYRVVRNRAISAARSASRRRKYETATAETKLTWFATENDPGHAEMISEALKELDDQYRQVIVARIWGKLTFEQIAETVGVSTTTAYRRYEAGLRQLRERLGLSWLTNNDSTKS